MRSLLLLFLLISPVFAQEAEVAKGKTDVSKLHDALPGKEYTAKVTDVPKSWADLWKPEYAGHMIFLDDERSVIGLTLLTLGYDVNTTDPKQLDEAKTKLKQLVPVPLGGGK